MSPRRQGSPTAAEDADARWPPCALSVAGNARNDGVRGVRSRHRSRSEPIWRARCGRPQAAILAGAHGHEERDLDRPNAPPLSTGIFGVLVPARAAGVRTARLRGRTEPRIDEPSAWGGDARRSSFSPPAEPLIGLSGTPSPTSRRTRQTTTPRAGRRRPAVGSVGRGLQVPRPPAPPSRTC
jgi:hypothetical protein